MPSLANAGISVASPEHLDPPQLRAHKSLRRRPNVPLNSPSAAQTIKPVGHNGLPSGTASLPPAPVRPLTPPAVASTEDSNTHGAHIATTPSLLSVSDAITPRPSHPPTPETTPPQVAASAQRPALKQLAQSFSSSRADSFRTALEIISDAGTETPSRSARSSSFVTRQSDPSDHSDTRSGSGETTPIPSHTSNRMRSATPEIFMAESRQDATRNPPAPAPRQKGPASSRIDRDSDTAEHLIYMVGSDADSTDVLPVRSKSVRRQGADSHEPVGGLSIEQFREQIGWPQTEPTTAEPDASRRFSNVSTTSTVEVMIIDSPRSTQRSLRHTEKRSSLRSVSSPLTKSEHTSLGSNPDSQHRLVHKSARITEQDRRSVASEMSISGISTMSFLPPNVEIVPVVVIPERRSSLKSSTSTSRNTSQSRSRQSSRRAPVASGSRPGSLEPPRRKERTLSDASTNADKRARSRSRSDGRPVIPQRNSSLSAPTSRNNSRTTSLTSDSLRNHTLAMEQETRKKPAPLPLSQPEGSSHGRAAHDVPEAAKTQSIIIGVEDMSHLRPPSMPYTQVSIPSSSPGVIEISEARTIAIFPHNNESLLLVEPQSQPTAREQIPDIASQDKPQTPVPSTQFDVESPLKNPRQPPKPPVCQVSPPSPVQDASRQLGAAVSEAEANGRPARRFGSIRRPWMNRKADNPEIDGRLQPFWRPRRFWDDSETDTSSPNGSPVEDRHHHEPDTVIKNSLGMPQQRTVLEGPPISRNPETRRRLGGHHHAANRGTLVGSSQVFTPEALYSQTSLHHHRFQSLSWWRLRLRTGKVRNLRKRMRRVWQQHGERRREAKREKLKQSIGDAVLVDSSTSPRP